MSQPFTFEPFVFNDPDYVLSLIVPNSKILIEEMISTLKKKYPDESHTVLRRKLLRYINSTRAVFQEKHMEFLGMREEHLARGGVVPIRVDKYLEDLSGLVDALALHYQRVTQLINADQQKQAQDYANRIKANHPQVNVNPFPQGSTLRYPFMRQHVPGSININNLSQYTQNLIFNNTRLPTRNTFLNPQVFTHQRNPNPAPFNRPSTISQPVITEAPPDEPVSTSEPPQVFLLKIS